MHSLKPIIAHVPHAPGVYRFLDGAEEVLYVGKAIDLKKRVSSYFRDSKDAPLRLKKLVEKIVDIQYTVVASELEALILETNLIKSFRPRYNILMKDDKSYVYLKITIQESLPRIVLTRRVESDGAIYFGPKTSMNDLRRILDVLKKFFPYRHCPLFIQFKESSIDVDDHRKRCFGACVAEADPAEYRQAIDQIAAFFRGKTEELEASLKVQMESAVAGKHFEQAALLRDRLAAVRKITETQRVSALDHASRDVLGLAIEGGSAFVTLLIFREGKLIDQQGFVLSGVDVDPSRVLSAFLEQYYERATDLPHEIFLPHALDHAELLESWLYSTTNRRIHLLTPERGKNRELLELAASNAASFAKQSQVKWLLHSGQDPSQALAELQALLGLPRLPRRIEGYDISHLGGTDTVGSMVVFEGGLPKTSDYRHFKLRTVQEKIDDYQAMGEVMARRLKYVQKRPANFRKPKKKELPSLAKILKKEKLDAEGLEVHSMLVAEERGKIVGMGRLKILLGEHKESASSAMPVSELASLWVSPKHRGEGLGQQLVRWLLAKQKKGKVYAIPNPEFVDWYGALGFHVTSTEIPLILTQKLKKCTAVFQLKNPVVMVYRFIKEGGDSSFTKKPDLIVVDGGRGQLNVALAALKSVSLAIPMIGLAKQEEDIYEPNRREPLRLPRETPALQLLMRLRDEAHRFALTHQRDLREKRMLR